MDTHDKRTVKPAYDPHQHRQQLMAEHGQVAAALQEAEQRVVACRDRLTFLKGAIAVLNDQLGPIVPDPA